MKYHIDDFDFVTKCPDDILGEIFQFHRAIFGMNERLYFRIKRNPDNGNLEGIVEDFEADYDMSFFIKNNHAFLSISATSKCTLYEIEIYKINFTSSGSHRINPSRAYTHGMKFEFEYIIFKKSSNILNKTEINERIDIVANFPKMSHDAFNNSFNIFYFKNIIHYPIGSSKNNFDSNFDESFKSRAGWKSGYNFFSDRLNVLFGEIWVQTINENIFKKNKKQIGFIRWSRKNDDQCFIEDKNYYEKIYQGIQFIYGSPMIKLSSGYFNSEGQWVCPAGGYEGVEG